MIPTYRPSGGFGIATLLYALVALLVMAGCAFVYQLGLKWIPFIYISVLLTVAFGFVGGVLGAITLSKGHCRNLGIAGLVTLLIAGGGLAAKHFFQYRDTAAELTNLVDDMQQRGELEAGEVDFSFADYVKVRVEEGWNIGRVGRGGAPIAGMFVWLIWAIEAVIVLYMTWSSSAAAARSPYNEMKSEWADEEEVLGVIPTTDSMVEQIAGSNSIEQLLQAPPPATEEDSNVFLQYTMNSIPGEESEDAYLSVDKITVTVNNKGETSKDEKSLWKYLIVNPSQRAKVTESLSHIMASLSATEASLPEQETKG